MNQKHLKCIHSMHFSEMNFNKQNRAHLGHHHQNMPYTTSDYGSMSTLYQSTSDLATNLSAFSEYGSMMTLHQPEALALKTPKEPPSMVTFYQSIIYLKLLYF